jgi:hypothetical protein
MRKILRRTLIGVGLTLLIIVVLAGLYLFWYTHRPLPEAVQDRPLFQGVTYTRRIRQTPRPQIIHVVQIDLDAPGIGFLVTPADDIESYDYAARTTSQFLDEFDVQVAINADGFEPWWEYGPLNYYPHERDGTNATGLTISQGELVTQGTQEHKTALYISQDNQVTFDQPGDELYNVISGLHMLVQDGAYVDLPADGYIAQLHPRTAVGLSQDGRTLILVMVDGRQPNYSDGASLPELAAIMIEYGSYTALNLDGGGSSALVVEGADGQPLQLGSAIHTRIPGRERPIANHLGVFAQRLDS